MKNELTNIDGSSHVLKETVQALLEGITGLAASERRDWFKSAGHVLQQIRSGKFLSQVQQEWNDFRTKGRIKDDYPKSDQNTDCLQDLLSSLDQDLPDTSRFEILKRIYLVAATETKSTRDSIIPQQYLAMARKLNSGEVAVLLTTHRLADEKIVVRNEGQNTGVSGWLDKIATESGLKHPELVAQFESGLMEKGFLTPRTYSDKSGITLGKGFRLTSFGKDFCDFVSAYDVLKLSE